MQISAIFASFGALEVDISGAVIGGRTEKSPANPSEDESAEGGNLAELATYGEGVGIGTGVGVGMVLGVRVRAGVGVGVVEPVSGVGTEELGAEPAVLGAKVGGLGGELEDGALGDVAAGGAHEAAARAGVLVAVGGEAVAAAAGGGLAELVELEGLLAAHLAEEGGAAGAPGGEAGEEALVPEEREEEHGGAGDARRGGLEAQRGGQEVGEGPQQQQGQHQVGQHRGHAPRPPLHHAQDAHSDATPSPGPNPSDSDSDSDSGSGSDSDSGSGSDSDSDSDSAAEGLPLAGDAGLGWRKRERGDRN